MWALLLALFAAYVIYEIAFASEKQTTNKKSRSRKANEDDEVLFTDLTDLGDDFK